MTDKDKIAAAEATLSLLLGYLRRQNAPTHVLARATETLELLREKVATYNPNCRYPRCDCSLQRKEWCEGKRKDPGKSYPGFAGGFL